jgi:hypothetical protein
MANHQSFVDHLNQAILSESTHLIHQYIRKMSQDEINNAFLLGCRRNCIHSVRTVFKYNPDIQMQDHLPFMIVCSRGYMGLVRYFCEELGENPSCNNNEAIVLASGYGEESVVKYLMLDKRVDPSARMNEAMTMAILQKKHHIVGILLRDVRTRTYLENKEILLQESQSDHQQEDHQQEQQQQQQQQ